MRYIYSFLFVFLGLCVTEGIALMPQHFSIEKKEYDNDTQFEILSDDVDPGIISKISSYTRVGYELYGLNGWEATGITRALSFGSLFIWAKEVDIYDKDENDEWQWIGMVEGWLFPSGMSKYDLCNEKNECIATAWLDNECSSYTLYAPESSTRFLGSFRRQFIDDICDSWDATIYEPEAFNPKLLRIFSAFICDTQDLFKRDIYR
jgi:hypothetical protein